MKYWNKCILLLLVVTGTSCSVFEDEKSGCFESEVVQIYKQSPLFSSFYKVRIKIHHNSITLWEQWMPSHGMELLTHNDTNYLWIGGLVDPELYFARNFKEKMIVSFSGKADFEQAGHLYNIKDLHNLDTAATGQYLREYLSQGIEDAEQDPESVENLSEFTRSLEYFDEWRHKLVLSDKNIQGKYNKEEDQWVITSGLLANDHIYKFHKNRENIPGGPWQRTTEVREITLHRIKCK